jgi:hypothetical protein
MNTLTTFEEFAAGQVRTLAARLTRRTELNLSPRGPDEMSFFEREAWVREFRARLQSLNQVPQTEQARW